MKDEKLLRFLNAVNFNDSLTQYFKDYTVKEVLLEQKTNTMRLVLECDELIPINIFDELYKSGNTLNGVNKVIYKFIVKNNTKYLEEYFNYYFDKLLSKCPMLKCIDRDKIKFDNSNINIPVLNNVEKDKIESLKEKIEIFLSDMGFDLIEVTATIDEEERKKFKEQLNSTVEVVQNRNTKQTIKGNPINGEISQIKNLMTNEDKVVLVAKVFGLDSKSTQSGWYIISLKLTDYTDSIISNIFTKKEEEYNYLLSQIKKGKWYKFKGNVKYNTRSNDYEFGINDIETYDKKENNVIVDDAPVKRVELHAHTMMSQMDGVVKLDLSAHTCELISKTIDMGYKAVAITDHNGCQAFPICYNLIKSYNKKQDDPNKKFKGLYGTELTLVEDMVNIVVRPIHEPLLESTYVVFDTETTGFNAGAGDQMIEIGAVKIKDGQIIDRFDEFINPNRPLPKKITELTQITDDMLKDADDEEEVTKRFLNWAGDLPMVAHNAKFDISFIEMSMKKYGLGEFKNTVIDTLELSRTLDRGYSRHSLSALVKRYNVDFDEDAHHRADYDAEGTALVFNKMIKKLSSQNYDYIDELEKLISKEDIYKFGRTYHFNAIALNRTGLKNLFKIISLANTTYLYKTPRILRSKLNELREGLIIGSGCYESEVFNEAKSKDGEELTNIINFYD